MKSRPLSSIMLAAAVLLAGAGLTPVQAQTLRWASQGDPMTMDPHSQNEGLTNSINQQVYERLVTRDRKLAIVPGLAVSWSQPSPLVWRFKLRPNVTFHNGAPFNADAVVAAITWLKGDAGKATFVGQALGVVAGAAKVDDLTVDVRTTLLLTPVEVDMAAENARGLSFRAAGT